MPATFASRGALIEALAAVDAVPYPPLRAPDRAALAAATDQLCVALDAFVDEARRRGHDVVQTIVAVKQAVSNVRSAQQGPLLEQAVRWTIERFYRATEG